jgi:hypothetical protein
MMAVEAEATVKVWVNNWSMWYSWIENFFFIWYRIGWPYLWKKKKKRDKYVL